MRWSLIQSRVVGGMRPAEGKAPFARGASILAQANERERFLQVRGYVHDEAEGDELDREGWEALQASGQGVSLATPCPAAAHAAIWILRPSFTARATLLGELVVAGALVGPEVATPAGSVVAVAREDIGNPIRDRWAMEQFETAWKFARAARWSDALSLADLAFVLSRGLVVERVALLSLALERAGRKTGADGLIEMAAGSRGAEFGRHVREKTAELAAQCMVVSPVAAPAPRGPRFRLEMQKARADALRNSSTGEKAA
jgi:hypothetical protein